MKLSVVFVQFLIAQDKNVHYNLALKKSTFPSCAKKSAVLPSEELLGDKLMGQPFSRLSKEEPGMHACCI